MRYIKYIILFTALFLIAGTVWAFPLRSISTASWDYYSYGDNGFQFKEVGIYRLNEDWSVVGKAEFDRRPYDTTVKGMGGVVFTLFSYSYMETSYGVSVSDGNTVAHHLLADYYYERENYLLMASSKADLGEEQKTFMPSLAGKWYILQPLSLWGKYTASFDDLLGFDNSFWGEAEYALTPKFLVKAGGTVGSYHAERNSPRRLEYSGLGGLTFKPGDTMRFSYLFEYLVRKEYDMISNSLIVDIRF
jgi:hypothetical protein